MLFLQSLSRQLSFPNMNPKIMIFIRVAKQRKLSTNCYYMKALKDRSISFLASSTQVQRNIFQPTKVCFFSSAPNENTENEEMEDEDLKKRNKSIRINPKGLSNLILPNQMVYKINPKTGEKRKVPEVSIGSFWMMKDLRETNNKPILSNKSLIPVSKAESFPYLKGLTSLAGENVDLPDVFVKSDGTSENSCTLVAISYKDFGYKMLSKWVEPFEQALSKHMLPKHDNSRIPTSASIVHLMITEGRFLKLFRRFLISSLQKNTPIELHNSTYTFYGNCEAFRDVLRMHNTLTGYVILLDGQGRVRWMGSGEPASSADVLEEADANDNDEMVDDNDELDVLIQCAKELIQGDDGSRTKIGESSNIRIKQNTTNQPTRRVGKKDANK